MGVSLTGNLPVWSSTTPEIDPLASGRGTPPLPRTAATSTASGRHPRVETRHTRPRPGRAERGDASPSLQPLSGPDPGAQAERDPHGVVMSVSSKVFAHDPLPTRPPKGDPRDEHGGARRWSCDGPRLVRGFGEVLPHPAGFARGCSDEGAAGWRVSGACPKYAQDRHC